MPTFNQGQVNFGTPGGNTTDSANLSTRRLYDFSDRIADLAPDESPFFVYLSKVGKVPTTDSQFRFLEDRTKVHMTDRSFLIKGGQTLAAAGSNTTLLVDTSGGARTITLPASPAAGDEVTFLDAKYTFDSNNLTVGRNSSNIVNAAADLTVATEGAGFTLVYSGDATVGWTFRDK